MSNKWTNEDIEILKQIYGTGDWSKIREKFSTRTQKSIHIKASRLKLKFNEFNLIDLIGYKFGKLTVLRFNGMVNSRKHWIVQCLCGSEEKSVAEKCLKNGDTKSCGCTVGGYNFSDLTGKIFGRWLVIKRVSSIGDPNGIKYKCRCDCRTEKYVLGESLTSGHSKSCGCLNKEMITAARGAIDLTNQIFGKLTAIKRVSETGQGRRRWICECECGKEASILTHSLTSGNTQSCGCLLDEIRRRSGEDWRNYGLY